MDNEQFLKCVSQSFKKFVETGSRSNKKLKVLHGAIAEDLINKLGIEYEISSLGFGNGKEGKIQGRYIDKNVDITVYDNKKAIAGIGVKFVMQNYSQNSNNYFENMLGETANIRSCKIHYFQIFIIPDKMPYYKNNGTLKKWESFSEHNSHKYKVLSNDNIETFVHTPTKTLLFVVRFPEIKNDVKTKVDYYKFYNELPDINLIASTLDYGKFESSVIFNNYPLFIEKVVHYIKSL